MNEPTTRGGRHFGPEAVRAFYDAFRDSHMIRYLEEPNLRIEKAIARILAYVSKDSTVFEIGCGIGLVAERVAGANPKGLVFACDVSEKNVELARHRVKVPNVSFRVGDVLRGFDELRSWLSRPVDVVAMVDVIEHLPLEEHGGLFRNLRGVMSQDSTLILTYPSPHYQHYLQENRPDELQIIDEVVELGDVLNLAAENRLALKHFSLEDVWLKNQYAHCVLRTSVALGLTEEAERLDRVTQEIVALIPAGDTFVLVDQEEWGVGEIAGRRCLPFLERDGQYWGPPPDDATAIAELERLRLAGARFIAVASPAFWWLEYFAGFHRHLRGRFRCAIENDRIVVFDLRS